ncbi:four-carbon acid sugar kinase family protein [Flexithrix dorotheae]|uniref:four-carbon acid sugar kinase family protein n=1 Tax=Flexithrix dorotheae TaxID=70993 RepID=UPI0003680EEE|nr:four-carbon acid sugar kinase family protein [Flexithrix dorotheae]
MNFTELTEILPKASSKNLLHEINVLNSQLNRSIVVLDDDPTGTQTVYDLPVLTTWEVSAIEAEFVNETPVFYILTNSRSLVEAKAVDLAKEIKQNLNRASQITGRKYQVISRGDSTLRGHFPKEVYPFKDGKSITILAPAFFEGGRYTINDIHYVRENEELIPAAETPFAKDKAFGYSNSNLQKWIVEKSKGEIPLEKIKSISIQDIREGGKENVFRKLSTFNSGDYVVVNAFSYKDLEVVVLGLLNAEMEGKKFVFRTAASIVKVFAGLETKPLLNKKSLNIGNTGGNLIIFGSYVPKSTAQLGFLKNDKQFTFLEIDVPTVLAPENGNYLQEVIGKCNLFLKENKTVIVHTSRELVAGKDESESLNIGNRISEFLVQIVRNLSEKPRYVLAKGGITSSDVATKGLGIRRAKVLGQIIPGVPVWEQGTESKFPQVPYIVFPGNVGGNDAISNVIKSLK